MSAATLPTPFFLPERPGKLFAIHHRPVAAIEPRGNVLVVPAFNEEMNRCRSMVTRQAQALGTVGIGTLVVDLYGTGDSAGEHGDARWTTWRANVRAAIDWLDRQAGGCIALLGIRLGVALALDALREAGDGYGGQALIAWQPVVDGKSYLTQFMRTKIAANMDRSDIPRETTAALRAQLAAGDSIEVAGYTLHPELAAAIDAQQIGALPPPAATPIAWLEKQADGEDTPAAAARAIADWRQAGIDVALRPFAGPAFWSLYERALAPELIGKTTRWIESLRGRP